MRITPQQEQILKIHRDMQFHCSTEYEYIRDHRKRISELNNGYLKEQGYELKAERCDGRCGKKHSSALVMRKAVPLRAPAKYQVSAEDLAHAQDLIRAKNMCELFDQGASTEEIFSVA